VEEKYEGFTEDNEFFPCVMLISEGVVKDNIQTTLFQIDVAYDLGEEFEEVIDEFDLENNGYTLEGIALAYLESEQEDLLEQIEGFDTESATLVMYLFTEESMRATAEALKILFTDAKLFRKTVKQNLGFIRDRYD
jgi:hypothetical protein